MLLFMAEPRNIKPKEKEPKQNNFNDLQEEEVTTLDEPKESMLAIFKNSLVDIMKDPVSRNVTIAGMFNYAGGYACMYFMPVFFQHMYPLHKVEFASINALSLSCLGFISTLAGGLISDRFQSKNPKILAQVCAIGSLLAFPVSMICFMCTNNFWLSMACLSLKYLLGESWFPPCLTMLQNTFGK